MAEAPPDTDSPPCLRSSWHSDLPARDGAWPRQWASASHLPRTTRSQGANPTKRCRGSGTRSVGEAQSTVMSACPAARVSEGTYRLISLTVPGGGVGASIGTPPRAMTVLPAGGPGDGTTRTDAGCASCVRPSAKTVRAVTVVVPGATPVIHASSVDAPFAPRTDATSWSSDAHATETRLPARLEAAERP